MERSFNNVCDNGEVQGKSKPEELHSQLVLVVDNQFNSIYKAVKSLMNRV
jgi:hypothetical protein